MRYAVNIPNFGDFADPAGVADLASVAERAGWDGLFVWDHILGWQAAPVGDPWVILAAAAARTERLRIGTMVTPLPRRRPWVLSRQVVSLDHLSGGRVVLGVGIGYPPEEEFGTFAEPTDERVRADMLDEGLAILTGMWSGEPFGYEGIHYHVRTSTFLPTPVQRPRVPIWVAGMWPFRRPFRRAARFDGVAPIRTDMAPMSPDEVAEVVAYVRSHRTSRRPFDVVVGGPPPDDPAAFEQAGVTWYQIGPDYGEGLAETRSWVAEGPPR
jgi:alkanesulfonate monooxygenase SsuD/methylene tetrahydromethanopterin reductase-like flavin-dependent oxidoreductase (luciferase family)